MRISQTSFQELILWVIKKHEMSWTVFAHNEGFLLNNLQSAIGTGHLCTINVYQLYLHHKKSTVFHLCRKSLSSVYPHFGIQDSSSLYNVFQTEETPQELENKLMQRLQMPEPLLASSLIAEDFSSITEEMTAPFVLQVALDRKKWNMLPFLMPGLHHFLFFMDWCHIIDQLPFP